MLQEMLKFQLVVKIISRSLGQKFYLCVLKNPSLDFLLSHFSSVHSLIKLPSRYVLILS
jgi:hypothetical protein